MINNKTEDTQVDEFLKNSPILPCFIKGGDNGKIETAFDGFDKKNIPITKVKENSTKKISEDCMIDSNIIIDKKYIYNIFFTIFNLKYESKNNINEKTFEKKKSYLIEHKLYSFNVREEDLSFSKYYVDQFQMIANNHLSDTEKAQELEKIFSKTGYFIPKKIYIGGMLVSKSNKFRKNKGIKCNKSIEIQQKFNVEGVPITKKESDIYGENIDFKFIFEDEKTEKIGGDKNSKTYEEWYKSINLSNSSVIEFANIITAGDILDNELKEKLRKPLRIIEDKYSRKKKYLENLENIYKIRDKADEKDKNNEKLTGKKGYGDFSKGICKESNAGPEPYIYKEKFIIDTHVSYIYPVYREELHKRFKDIIVGFEIIDDRKDGYNGEWQIKNEPLGAKEIILKFASCVLRGQDFTIYV